MRGLCQDNEDIGQRWPKSDQWRLCGPAERRSMDGGPELSWKRYRHARVRLGHIGRARARLDGVLLRWHLDKLWLGAHCSTLHQMVSLSDKCICYMGGSNIYIYRKKQEYIYAVVGFLKLNNISEHGGATERCKRSIYSNNSYFFSVFKLLLQCN